MQAGVTEELLQKVHAWRDHPDFSPSERAALRFTEQFVASPEDLDDRAIEPLREHFDDGTIVDLVLSVAKYLAIGRVVKVLELDHTCPLPTGASSDESAP